MLQFFLLVATLGCYLGYRYIRDYLEVRQIRACEKTEDPPKSDSSLLGLKGYRQINAAIKNKTSQEENVKQYEIYGNTYSFHMFGRNMIDTRDPENIKAILATQFAQFSLGQPRYNSFAPLFGDGIFTHIYGGGPEGEPWRHSRTMLRPQFSREQIQDLAVLEGFVQILISRIPRNETCDLQELFFKFTMDTATDFLFGESVNSLSPDCAAEEAHFYKQFTRGTELCMYRSNLGDLYFLQGDRKEFNQVCKDVHSYIDKFTKKAARLQQTGKATSFSTGGKYIFLEEIAQSISDPVRLRSELLSILLAGRDTTASLLSICFHQLARHKDVWAKLRHKIMENIGDRLPTYEDIRSLKYVQYVLNESGPDGKSKILVKKGTFIFYSTYSLHRSNFYGDDVNEFKPSRWESPRPGRNYLPFNGGPRICLGQQYALIEASYVVIRLLQTFEDIENRDPVIPFIEGLTLTMASDRGTQVALKPANPLV